MSRKKPKRIPIPKRKNKHTVSNAEKELRERVQELPFTGLFGSLHEGWERLRQAGFHRPEPTHMHPFQLAALLKYIILFAKHKKKRARYDMAHYINVVKDLWRATEEEHSYPEDPGTRATFLIRFDHATLPFALHQESIHAEKQRTLSLLVTYPAQDEKSEFNINQEFRSEFGLTPEQLIYTGWEFYLTFCRRVCLTERDLELRVPEEFKQYVPPALEFLAGTRKQFREEYKRVQTEDSREVFYEPNPLLWMPIIKHKENYYAPFPELIAYAVTRGLFFSCAHRCGSKFSGAFGAWFEAYVGDLLKKHLRAGEIISEVEEKAAGYEGKKCDWTVLLGDVGILVECKSSALFSRSKKLATPDAIREDLIKNLIGKEKGKGLMQLNSKLQAIKNRELPSPFKEKYAKIKKWYPIVLIYDRLVNANDREGLRGILDSELSKIGISSLNYQIWHVEELENLLNLVPETILIDRLQNKWSDPKVFPWSLNNYLASFLPQHRERLGSYILSPGVDSSAGKILGELADV